MSTSNSVDVIFANTLAILTWTPFFTFRDRFWISKTVVIVSMLLGEAGARSIG
jgi:hypothetical protein